MMLNVADPGDGAEDIRAPLLGPGPHFVVKRAKSADAGPESITAASASDTNPRAASAASATARRPISLSIQPKSELHRRSAAASTPCRAREYTSSVPPSKLIL